MALFSVQRYYGDEDELGNNEKEEVEKKRLDKLRDKTKRKRKELDEDVTSEKVSSEMFDAKRIEKAGPFHAAKKEKEHKKRKESDAPKSKRKKSVKDPVSKETSGVSEDEVSISMTKSDSNEEVFSKRTKTKKKSGKAVSNTSEVRIIDETEKEANESGKSYENREDKTRDDESLEYFDPTVEIGATESTDLNEVQKNGREKEKSDIYFKTLGSFGGKKEKVVIKRSLPRWIAEGKQIPSDIDTELLSIHDATFLEKFSKESLQRQNIRSLFPVQSCVIPFILSQNSKKGSFHNVGLLPSDICVSAPTGSGKTLAYALPIIQILSKCEYKRLQAIVILPSRDLALQVRNVLSIYTTGTHVKIGLACGVKSFHDEQLQIMSKGYDVSFIALLYIHQGFLTCLPA